MKKLWTKYGTKYGTSRWNACLSDNKETGIDTEKFEPEESDGRKAKVKGMPMGEKT